MVDSPAAPDALFVEIGPKAARRESANREVHPEDPRPGKMLDDEAPGQRAEDGGKRPYARQPSLNFRPLMRGIEVADDGHRDRLDRAGADSLNEPEGDQRRHRPREPAKDRTDEEDRDSDQDHRLAPDEIRELAEHHGRRGLRQ